MSSYSHATTVDDDLLADSAHLAELVCEAFAETDTQVAVVARAARSGSAQRDAREDARLDSTAPAPKSSDWKQLGSAQSAGLLPSSALGAGALTPGALTPSALTPGALTPSALTPSALTPSALTPSALTPSAASPGGSSPGALLANGSAPSAPVARRADAPWVVLAASERLSLAWRSAEGHLALPEGVSKSLSAALEGAWVARVRQTRELDAVPGLGNGPWRVEVAPWALRRGPQAAILVFNNDAELEALRRRFEQVNRAESLGLLAGSVAHDFNNLLTGIRGSLALVRHHVSPEGRANALAAADLAAQRAGEVTRRLLTFSRGPERVHKLAEPQRVLQETVDLMRCIPDTSRVDTDIDAELGQVEMLPSDLHQVVLNLLINASDAVRGLGGASGVMLRASTTWRADAGGARTSRRWLRVSVIDQGPGMDASMRQHIFEPFFTTKARGKGTGLGLCSVKELVERVGGWLEVESEPQRGSAFHVYLPLTSEAGESAPPPSREVPRVRERVLICDDEGRLADLTVGLLEEFGFSAQAVVRGEEALAVFRSERGAGAAGAGAAGGGAAGAGAVHAGQVPGVVVPGVVVPGVVVPGVVVPDAAEGLPKVMLLDVNLGGGMQASEVLDELVRRGTPVRVILSSGLSQEDVPAALREHPLVVSYLAKPYTVDDLVAAINAALEHRSA